MKRSPKRPSFEQACAQFTGRYTMEHVPAWAGKPFGPHRRHYYAPQYKTDREWYERTYFHADDPELIKRDNCYSTSPTWPLGEWLSKPYTRAELHIIDAV